MALIDATYFIGPITLANTDKDYVSDGLQVFINRYEQEFLNNYLGWEFAKLFTTGLTAPSPAQRWIDLRSGVDYAFDSQNYRWDGLIRGTTAFTKYSPIAEYVYWQYTRNQAMPMTGVGTTTSQTENANRISPIDKQVFAWNSMCEALKSMWEFLTRKSDVYPEFDICKTVKLYPQNAFNL